MTKASAARKSSPREYLIPLPARARGFTDEFLARATRRAIVESPTLSSMAGALSPARTGLCVPMFAKDGDEPGAGNTGAHRIRKGGDGACNSPNQPLAQIPSPKSAATIAATIILNKALSLGIRVLTDGNELAMLVPVKVPRAVRVRFETHEFRAEVIAVIQANAAARGGV